MQLTSIELRPLLAVEIAADPPVDLGGGRRYVPFTGGSFSGPQGVTGSVAAGGADWQRVRPDGVVEIDARYALLTDDGDAVEVWSTGLRKATPEVAERIGRGDAVSADEYYFRTHIRLSTTSIRLRWLNDVVAVSTGRRERDVVHIHIHEVR